MRCFEQRALTRKKMQEHILVLPLKIVTDCTKWTTTMGAERMREKKTEQRECVFAFSGFSLVLTKEIIDHKNRIDDCLSVFFLSLFILASPFFRVLLFFVCFLYTQRKWNEFEEHFHVINEEYRDGDDGAAAAAGGAKDEEIAHLQEIGRIR